MIKHAMFVAIVTLIITQDLFAASRGNSFKDTRFMMDEELISEQHQLIRQVEQDAHAWRHAVPERACCYKAGMLCNCCVPCIAGCVQSVIDSERAFDDVEQMCSLEALPSQPLIVGCAAGSVFMLLFDRWFLRPDQTKQHDRLDAIIREMSKIGRWLL